MAPTVRLVGAGLGDRSSARAGAGPGCRSSGTRSEACPSPPRPVRSARACGRTRAGGRTLGHDDLRLGLTEPARALIGEEAELLDGCSGPRSCATGGHTPRAAASNGACSTRPWRSSRPPSTVRGARPGHARGGGGVAGKRPSASAATWSATTRGAVPGPRAGASAAGVRGPREGARDASARGASAARVAAEEQRHIGLRPRGQRSSSGGRGRRESATRRWHGRAPPRTRPPRGAGARRRRSRSAAGAEHAHKAGAAGRGRAAVWRWHDDDHDAYIGDGDGARGGGGCGGGDGSSGSASRAASSGGLSMPASVCTEQIEAAERVRARIRGPLKLARRRQSARITRRKKSCTRSARGAIASRTWPT